MPLTASIVVKWMSSDGANQEVSCVLQHSFKGSNAAKWTFRLDGYLPLLEDAKDDRNNAGLVQVCVEKQIGEPSRSSFSPFPIPSGRLKVEEEVFSVSKELLAVHSQFFTTLFYGDFKERDQKTVELKEASCKAFNSLIGVLFRSNPNSEEYICELIEMPDRYGMLGVMKRCFKYVLSLTWHENNPCLPTLLLLSDTFRHQELLNHVLQSFKSPIVLSNAFRAVAANLTEHTSVAVVEQMSSIAIAISQFSPKVWLKDSWGRVNFELFFDEAPDIARAFVRLFTHNNAANSLSTITKDYGGTFAVQIPWRKEIVGSTPRKETGWLLYTNDVNSFEITQDDKPNEHFFGRVIMTRFSGCSPGEIVVDQFGIYLSFC